MEHNVEREATRDSDTICHWFATATPRRRGSSRYQLLDVHNTLLLLIIRIKINKSSQRNVVANQLSVSELEKVV